MNSFRPSSVTATNGREPFASASAGWTRVTGRPAPTVTPTAKARISSAGKTVPVISRAAAAARLITGTVLPAELILAFAVGVTVGAGLPVTRVQPAEAEAKGSRPFVAVTDDGRKLFIKALGSDQRDADLLYRAY